jgi:hypothetical protein
MTTPIASADCEGQVTINTVGVPVWGNGPVTTALYKLDGKVISLPYTYKPGLSVTSATFVGEYSGTVDGVPVSGEVAYPVSWVYPTDCVVETTTTVPATTTTVPVTSTTRPGETTTTHQVTTTPAPAPCQFETSPGQCSLPPTGGNPAPAALGVSGIALGIVLLIAASRKRFANA